MPQRHVELMTKEKVLGFKLPPRLEQVGDEHSARVQDHKHRPVDGIFGKDRPKKLTYIR
jgi:hypothetical protein